MTGISVVIPAYNRAHLIGQTLDSLLRQTVPADEIVVVDDGSSDDTAKVAASFRGPVRVVRQENLGPAAARNRGFAESKGEFLHFFDSDDLALPNKHEVQMQALIESGGDIAYGPWVKGRMGPSGFTPENHVLQQKGLPKGDLIRALLTNWSIVPHACLFRRTIVERAGGFPEDLFVAEDQLMFLRCLLVGARVVHSAGTLELYRSDGATKLTANEQTANARQVRDWARFLCSAEVECREKGIHPTAWLGFRARACQAELDLVRFEAADPRLRSQVHALHGGHREWVNRAFLAYERKRDGLMQRMTGGRGGSSFRMGPPTRQQELGIQQLFERSRPSFAGEDPPIPSGGDVNAAVKSGFWKSNVHQQMREGEPTRETTSPARSAKRKARSRPSGRKFQ